MDNKQNRILKTIYEKNHIEGNRIVFKQFRNLKEFRFFRIERSNPNHRIKVYGQLKTNNVKDGHYNKFINVGEILIYGSLLFITQYDILFFWFNCLALTGFVFQLCFFDNPFEALKFYVNWYRLKFFNKKIESLPKC